jgi:hypothetical protein
MTQNAKRGLILPALILFALVVFAVLYICHRSARAHAHSPAQSQVEALNDALRNGLLTKPQYDAEIKKLKDQSKPNPQPAPQSNP